MSTENLLALRVTHPGLENGFKAYVNDDYELTAFDEQGVSVMFEVGNFTAKRPDKNPKGMRSIKVAAVNADLALVKAFWACKDHEPPVQIIVELFEFNPDDLTKPAKKVIKLTVTNWVATVNTLSMTASWKDLVNRRFMRRQYDASTHAGLALFN